MHNMKASQALKLIGVTALLVKSEADCWASPTLLLLLYNICLVILFLK